jgi:hypothetical protein
MFHSFRAAVAEARRHGDLYFAALIDRQSISEAFGEASSLWQGWIYTPAVTVWVFLSQCLSADHSCRDAVARLAAWRIARGAKTCSADTGAYCTARDALPEAACHELVRRSGRELEAQAPSTWLWHGRPVRVVDGTTLTMPDTPENQAEYPQPNTQKPGCGLPIARVLVVFSLAVGTVLEASLGQYKGKQTGENSLFRMLHHTLSEGDVVLADRCYSGWFVASTSSSASTNCDRATSAPESDWVKTITWCGSPNPPDPLGCRSNCIRHCRLNSRCEKYASA